MVCTPAPSLTSSQIILLTCHTPATLVFSVPGICPTPSCFKRFCILFPLPGIGFSHPLQSCNADFLLSLSLKKGSQEDFSENSSHSIHHYLIILLFIHSMSIISRMRTGISSILLTPIVHCLIQCLAHSRCLTNVVNVWIISFRQRPNQPGLGYICMYYYYI